MRSTEAAEAVAASLATKATYGGGGVAVAGGIASHDLIALAGLVIGCLGALMNWYFKHRTDQRHEREPEARMRRLALGRRTDTDLGELGEDE